MLTEFPSFPVSMKHSALSSGKGRALADVTLPET